MFLTVIMILESADYSAVVICAAEIMEDLENKENATKNANAKKGYTEFVLSCVDQSGTSVSLDWEEENATFDGSFVLYKNGEEYKKINDTSFTDSSLDWGQYTYYVEAYNNENELVGTSNKVAVKVLESKTVSSNYTLDEDMEMGDLVIRNSATLNLNGHTLTVYGSISMESYSYLKISKGYLKCYGSFQIDRYGYLYMTNANDYIWINGNVNWNSYYCGESCLYAGTIEIKGNFTHTLTNYSFTSKDDFCVILSGTRPQSVSFGNLTSYFNILELNNYSNEGVTFQGVIQAKKVIRNGCNVNCGEIKGKYGWTLEEDEEIAGDLVLLTDTLDLNGHTLTINGDFIQTGGEVFVNNGKLIVEGDYRIQTKVEKDAEISYTPSSGYLRMNSAEDYVRVEGNFYTYALYSNAEYLTDGVLELKGNFEQTSKNETNNFTASGNHTVLLSGNKKQEINFANVGSDHSYFANLEITNKSEEGVVFGSNDVMVKGQVNDNGNKTSGYIHPVATTTFADHKFQGNVYYGDSITTKEDVEIAGNVIVGDSLYLGGNLKVGKNLTIRSYLELNGKTVEVEGDINHTYGTFYIDGGAVYCKGNYTNAYNDVRVNRLTMTNSKDYFCVEGNVMINGYYNNTTLTAGTLEIKGDFTQKTGYYENNFAAEGSHVTIFSGTKKQTIQFESGKSYFNIVELKNYSEEGIYAPGGINANTINRNGCNIDYGNDGRLGWTLEEDETIEGDLFLIEDELDLNGHTLTVQGSVVQAGGTIHVNGGKLVIEKDYRIQSKDETGENVTYGKSNGILLMDQEEDHVKVKGDFVQGSIVDHSTKLTAGTLEIKGNFTQTSYASQSNFAATGSHKVLLSGNKKQEINFANVGSNSSYFANLEIANESEEGVVFGANDVMVKGQANDNGNKTSGYIRPVVTTTFADQKFQGNVFYGDSLTTKEDMEIAGNVIVGNDLYLGGNLKVGKNLTIRSRFELNGKTVEVEGDINHSYEIFYIDGGKVYCKGNYTNTYNAGNSNRLIMINSKDYFCVEGNVLINGYYNNNELTAGTLEIKGDFTQKNGYYVNNFAAEGSHVTIFSGTGKQTIQFESEKSYFNIVELNNYSEEGIYALGGINAATIKRNGCNIDYGNDGRLGWTLKEDESIEGDLFLIEDELDLNGHTLTVLGSVIQAGGTIHVNGGKLVVEKDYRIQSKNETEKSVTYGKSNGILLMDKEEDHVKVKGDFVQGSIVNHSTKLTAGTLEIKGNFTQTSYVSQSNFAATGTHKVLLSGNKKQEVNFANVGSDHSYFANLEIANESEEGVVFGSNDVMVKGMVDDKGNKTSGYIRPVATTTFANQKFQGNVYYGDSITTKEDMEIAGNVIVGASLYLGGSLKVGKTLTIRAYFELNGKTVEVEGDINHTYGTFYIDGGAVYCKGNYTNAYNDVRVNRLTMTNSKDYFCVEGNVMINGYYNNTTLTAGTLEIKGDFTQKTGHYENNFAAEGSHVTIFSGTGKQTIQFDSAKSHFNTVELRNYSEEGIYSETTIYANNLENYGSKVTYGNNSVTGWTLLGDEVIEDDLYIMGETMNLNGHSLTVNGNLILGEGTLKINGGELKVTGDFRIQGMIRSGGSVSYTTSNGILEMTEETDSVTVEKNLIVQTNGNHTGKLTAGTIVVKGDLYQYEANGIFAGTESHTIQLSGNNGQTVSFASSVANGNRIANLVVKNTSANTVKFVNQLYVSGQVKDESENIAGTGAIIIDTLSQLENWKYSGSVVLTGDTKCEQDLTIGGTFTVKNNFDVNGKILKVNYLSITNGDFKVNTGNVQCSNNMNLSGSSRLVMKNPLDYVVVSGDFYTASGNSHNGYLTDGVLEVKGDFTQVSGSHYNFCATENHKVVLKGKAGLSGRNYIQVVSFNKVDYSKFATLELTRTMSNYKFGTDVNQLCTTLIHNVTDEEAPKKVKSIYVSEASASSLKIGWEAAEDNEGVVGYEVYRNNVRIATTGNTSYLDKNLKPDTSYTYVVYAFDEARNVSEASDELYATTEQDEEAPEVPQNLKVKSKTGSSVWLGWDFSQDNVETSGYKIYRDGEFLADSGSKNEYKDSTITSGKSYTYQVLAYDEAGNESELSEEISGYGEMPSITRITPEENSALGGNSINIKVFFKNVGNSTGNKVKAEYSQDNGENWKDINTNLAGQQNTGDKELYASITWNTNKLTSGEYLVRITLYDADNNSCTKEILYQLDKDAPVAPVTPSAISKDGAVTISFLSSVSADTKYHTIYRRAENETVFQKIGQLEKNYVYFYQDTDVKIGTTYEYYITATDYFNQESEPSQSVFIQVAEDKTAPVIQGMSPTANSRVNKDSKITVNAYDAAGVASILLEYKDGEEWILIGEKEASKEGAAVFTWNNQELEDGTYTLRATAIDVNGNRGEEEYTRKYIVDNTGISKINITDVTADSSYVSLKWEDVGDEDFAYFQVEQKKDGKFVSVGTVKDILGMHIRNLEANTEYTFRVVGYDTLGNRGEESNEVNIETKGDTTPPVITQFLPASKTFSENITLSVTATDNIGVEKAVFEYSLDEKEWKALTTITKKAAGSNTFQYKWDISQLAEGSVYVRVRVYDTGENENVYKEGILTNSYVIDHTAPDTIADLKAEGLESYVSLTWTAPKATDVEYYKIYRAEDETGIYNLIKDKCTYANYYDSTVSYGETYSYKIKAVDLAGNVSGYSNETAADVKKDTKAPTIHSVSPSDGEIVGTDTEINVLVYDNVKVVDLTIEYKQEGTEDVWTNVEVEKVDAKDKLVKVKWDTKDLESGTYLFHIYAKDSNGNQSKTFTTSYKLDADAPEPTELTIEEKNWQIDLSWKAATEEDFAYYELFRKAYNETEYQCVYKGTEVSYQDKEIKPDINYSYYLCTYDTHGNQSSGEKKIGTAMPEDTIPPVANASVNMAGVTGMEMAFDGTGSTDNVRVTKYTWKMGDGTTKTGAQPTHIYNSAGTYTVILTVQDAAGNKASTKITVQIYDAATAGTVTLQVVDQNNEPLSSSYVYVNDNSQNSGKTFVTDKEGIVTISGENGDYQIAAYKQNYLPKEEYIRLEGGKNTTAKIMLESGDVVVGNLEVKKMELGEIMAAGIDLSEPSNYHTFSYKVTLAFAEAPLPVEYVITATGGGEAVRRLQDGGEGLEASSGKGRGESFYIIPVEGEGEEMAPLLVYMTDSGCISWLKDMFSVELGIINTADQKFVLKDSLATLKLPSELSLAVLNYKRQNLDIELGDIYGQQAASAIWYIRGDKSGEYSLSADFRGTLMPFEKEIHATFTTKTNVNVQTGEGLELTIMPEDAAYPGESYYIQYKLTNTSNRYFYNIQASFGDYIAPEEYIEKKVIDEDGNIHIYEKRISNYYIKDANQYPSVPVLYKGDILQIGVFGPGDTIYGTTVMAAPSSTEENENYFKLVDNFVEYLEGENIGVNVIVSPISSHATSSIIRHITIDNSIWGDPVDTSCGAYVDEVEALAVNGITTLSLDMNYSSMLTENDGEMGKGWSHNFQPHLKVEENMINLYWTPDSYSSFIREEAITQDRIYGTYVDEKYVVLSENMPEGQKFLGVSVGMENTVLERGGEYYTLTLPSGVIYEFDKAGRLKKMTDKNKREVTLTYGKEGDKKNTVTTVTEKATGKSIQLHYNEKGYLVKVTDETGRATKFTYENKCLTSITDPLGEVTTYTYDDKGRILTSTNNDGVVKVTNTYDEHGRVTLQKDAKGKSTKFAYEEDKKTGELAVTITNRDGNTEKVVSDRSGNVIRSTNGNDETTVYMYDSNNNLLSIRDAENQVTSYKYDGNGNQTEVRDAYGNVTAMTYDSNNNLTSVTDGKGSKTSYTYNDRNLLTDAIYSSGKRVHYTYNNQAQLTTEEIIGLGTRKYYYEEGYLAKLSDLNGNSQTYEYDTIGNLTKITDSCGGITRYTYDKANRVIKEETMEDTDTVYSSIRYTYDVNGNKTSVTDAKGSKTYYNYDANGELAGITRGSDNTTLTYQKDGEGHVTKQTAVDGSTTTFTYDAVGRVLTKTDEKGNTTSYQYNSRGDVTKETDAKGNSTSYTYYPNGKLQKETYADGTSTLYSYDACWNQTRVTLADNSSTTYEYDTVGNLVCVRDALGNEITYEYDIYGRNTSQTDANGNTTSYTYDAEGNCLTETNALGETTTYTYDNCNRLVTTTHKNQAGEDVSIKYGYDRYGRNTKVTDECGNTSKKTYDKNGNILTVVDGKGITVETCKYDSNNQLVSTTDALKVTDRYTYDVMGRVTKQTAQADTEVEQETKYIYNADGTLSQVEDAEEGTGKYGYDAAGNITKATDPMGGITTYTYDALGRKTKETNAIGSEHAYTYNAVSLLESYTNAKGEETTYSYDKAGRLKKVSDDAGNIAYTYDRNGNIVTVKDEKGVITRTYDALNRVTSYTDSNGNTINYSYNQMGYLDTMTYPNGEEVSYTYYDNGKLKSVTDGQNRVTTYEYDQNGRVTAQHNSNGTTDTYEYDKAGQLTSQKVVKGTKVLTETSYTYDEAGNITGKTTSEPEGNIGIIESVEMTYDKANRLTTYNGEEVTYDAEGNMTYGPDAEGNMTTFRYNSRNQLMQAGKVKYEYDAEGNRSAQVNTETGVRTEYVTDTVNQLSQVLMATETGNGTTKVTTYTYGNGLLSQSSISGSLTFHYNNIGSTILLTNAQGEKEENYSYGPYGELLSGDRSKTPYLYNGMYGVTTDANGLYYMRARYYNVAIKRFINQDVVDGSITNSQSLNKFSYVQGNPIRLTDPFGLCPDISLTRIGHAALDLLGIIPGFDGCDGINAVWYLIEGDYANAATSAVAAFPLLGSIIGSGIKWGAKGVANAEKIADGIKAGSRIIGNAGALIQSGGQTLESVGNLYDSYVKDGEIISWKNATDLITLGLSVAGMGMAGKSLAKDGKALKAVSQGNVNVKPAAVSNRTIIDPPYKMDLQKFAKKNESNTPIKINEKNIGHIFRDEEGHFQKDTAKNRALIEHVVNEKINFLGLDKYGNEWYAEILDDGKQIWAQVRNGQIRNGGVNNLPKTYNSETGLSNPNKPTQGGKK